MTDTRGARQNDATTCETQLRDALGGLALVVSCKSGAVARMLHEASLFTLGRGSDCDIVIEDDSVSRRHARLSFAGGWRVEDLGSRNGTVVDGRKLHAGEAAPLAPGSVVRFGFATAVLQLAEPARLVAPGEPRENGRAAAAFAGEAATGYVVRDEAMRALYAMIDLVAPSPLPVLIVGETGVGKELFARAIHTRSARASRAMVQINCAAIPAGMLESELFGYERGAFTGAMQNKAGLLETASGGTVLLDEIGELPLALQPKLLRVLETGECQRLGAVRPRPIDVRIVSSTNRDLREAVAAGEFRADLYHRLNGAPIRIPPLRERRADIVPLAEHFAARMARTLGREGVTIAADAAALLEAYPWPGNVRELRNVVERAVVLTRKGRLEAASLDLESTPAQSVSIEATVGDDAGGLRAELETMERRRVIEALEQCGNNQSRAAKLLGISRHALIARIERYNLQRPRKAAGT